MSERNWWQTTPFLREAPCDAVSQLTKSTSSNKWGKLVFTILACALLANQTSKDSKPTIFIVIVVVIISQQH